MESIFKLGVEADKDKYDKLVGKMLDIGKKADDLAEKFVSVGDIGSKAFKSITTSVADATKRLVGHRQSVEALTRAYTRLAAAQTAVAKAAPAQSKQQSRIIRPSPNDNIIWTASTGGGWYAAKSPPKLDNAFEKAFEKVFEKAWKKQQASLRSTQVGGQYPLYRSASGGGAGRGGGGGGGVPDDRGFFGKMFLSPGTGMSLSAADRWGIRASGIAATLFIWQNVKQIIASVFQPMLQFEKVLISVRTEMGLTASEAKRLGESAKQIGASFGSSAMETSDLMATVMGYGATMEEAGKLVEKALSKREEFESGTTTEAVRRLSKTWDDLLITITGSENAVDTSRKLLGGISDLLRQDIEDIKTFMSWLEKLKNFKLFPDNPDATNRNKSLSFSKRGFAAPWWEQQSFGAGIDADIFSQNKGINRGGASEPDLKAFGMFNSFRASGSETSARIMAAIEASSAKYGVPKELVQAVMQVESGYKPQAVSHKGAQGLMQLMPATAKSLGVTDPFNIEQNVDAGTDLLRRLFDKYNGSLDKVLAAYNAGETAVDRHGGVPPFTETMKYVPEVLRLYEAGGGDISKFPQTSPRWAGLPGLRDLTPEELKSGDMIKSGMSAYFNFFGRQPEWQKRKSGLDINKTLQGAIAAGATPDEIEKLREAEMSKLESADLAPTVKVWEQFYGQLQQMSEEYYKTQERMINDQFRSNVEKDPFSALMIRREQMYDLEKKKTAGFVKDQKDVYDELGSVENEKFFQQRRDDIVKRYEDMRFRVGMNISDQNELRKALLQVNKMQERDLNDLDNEIEVSMKHQLSPEKIKRLESMFEETGIMTERLYNALELRAAQRRTTKRWDDSPSFVSETVYYAEKIKNYENFNKRRLELEESYAKETNSVSEWTYNYQTKLIQLQGKQLEAMMGDSAEGQEKAAKITNARMLNLDIQYIEQKKGIWEEAYQITNIYSQELYNLESKRIDLIMQKYKKAYGEDSEITKRIEQQLSFANDVNKIRSTPGLIGGKDVGEAVWKTIEMNSQTTASAIVDTWTAAAYDMEEAFKQGFFNVMDSNFNNLEDTAITALDMIKKAVSDTLYEMLKAGFKPTFNSAMESIFSGGKAQDFGNRQAVGDWDMNYVEGDWMHSGGVVGKDRPMSRRFVPASIFAAAPRYHSGLIQANERPVIVRQDESILTPAQMSKMSESKVDVKVFNNTGQPAEVRETRGPDGMRNIEIMVGQMLSKDGPATRALQKNFGLSRRGVMRG